MTRAAKLLEALESAHGPMPKWMLRFLDKAYRIPADEDQEVGCLIWMGAISRGGQRGGGQGYGSFKICQRLNSVRAHVAIATATGLITDYRVPAGTNLSHQCHRSLCVERSHLILQPML